MGINVLPVAVDSDVIPAEHHNAIVSSLLDQVVPRDNNRTPGDLVGSLGTSVFRWLRAYCEEYRVGDAANNLKMYEGATGELWIERASASDEIIKLKEDALEIIISGASVFTFSAAQLTSVINYITYNSIESKLNVSKMFLGTIPRSTPTPIARIIHTTAGAQNHKSIVVNFRTTWGEPTMGTAKDYYIWVNGANPQPLLNSSAYQGEGSSGIIFFYDSQIVIPVTQPNMQIVINESNTDVNDSLVGFAIGANYGDFIYRIEEV